MTEYETFEDYVKNTFNIEPTELILISPEEQKKKTVAITADELINIWNELTEIELKAEKPKWHKVADGDLPEAENHFWSRTVLLQTNKDSLIIGFYDHANKAWYEKATDDIVYGVIAWYEIPKYTEE